MECLPIVQDDFPPDYKSVRDMLRTKILTCNAVVHLAGFYYGAEPQPVIPGPDRRSFTQMEYEIAMELKLPCYVFLCGEHFPFDLHDPEPADKAQLQLEHRARLLQRDELFYEFASPEELANRTRELQLSVENLRKELVKERARRRMAMGLAATALTVTLVGGVWMHGRQKQQELTNIQQTTEIATLRAQLEGPTYIVGKVNAAMALLKEQGKGSEEEMKAVAISLVAVELKKTVEEVKTSIDSAADLCRQLIAAARAEGSNDPAKLAESRTLEAETLRKLADAHLAAGRVNEAITALQQELAVLDREKQPELWAETAEKLADQLLQRGSKRESLDLRREAYGWAKDFKSFGPEHAVTLRLMSGLADGGIPDREARELIQFVLKTRERDLGPDHPDTLAAVAILARASSTAKECEALYRRVIDAKTKALGPEHAETLKAMVLFSKALKAYWRNFTGAADLMEKVLAIRQRKLGPEHPDTLTAMSILADVRSAQEDYPASISLLRRALEIRERVDGPDGFETLIVLNNLAIALDNSQLEGALDEAIKLDARVLDTKIRKIGSGQPSTLLSFRNHAVLLEGKGDMQAGRKLRLRALDEQEKAVGPNDTAFLTALNDTIKSFYRKADYATALPLAQRYLKLRETTQPEGATEVLDAMAQVADIQDELKNPAESVRLTQRVIQLCETKQPKLRSYLAGQYNNLSIYQEEVSQKAQALDSMRKAVEIAQTALSNNDDRRARYEKRLARLETEAKQPAGSPVAKAAPSKTEKTAPSIDKYVDFRKNLIDRMEKEKWREVKEVLPDSSPGHDRYVVGAFDGKDLAWLMQVDSRGDDNETLTFYYWSEGWLTSIVRIRKGAAVPTNEVAKMTDIYNFLSEKLVSWKRISDGKEEIKDPEQSGFAMAGQRVLIEGKTAQSIVLAAAKKAPAKPATPAPASPPSANTLPSIEDFASFRKQIDDQSKSAGWKEVRLDLTGTGDGRRVYLLGWFDGTQLRRLMHVDAVGKTGGSFTFYYWTKGGSFRTAFCRREGIGLLVKGATETTDTQNFFNDQLVSWERTVDSKKEIVDQKSTGYTETGASILAQAKERMAAIVNARTAAPTVQPASVAPTTTPAPSSAPPSLSGYADLRKSINAQLKSEGWKTVQATLSGAKTGRELLVTGWKDGKSLRKVATTDATDDQNGTWTVYYWSQGWLTSVFRQREGSAVTVKGVKKTTDTFNFWNGKLVGWKRTQDDAEAIEDPGQKDFQELGKIITAGGENAAAAIRKNSTGD